MLRLENNILVVQTRYDAGLVAALKSLPSSERRFDPARRAWLVDPRHGTQVADWIQDYLGQTVTVPQATQAAQQQLQMFKLYYLGAVKDRGNGERTAFGSDGNDWRYVFSEDVLRRWFEGIEVATPASRTTLYGVLGVKRGADETEIRIAYRRLVKQWHPDVCKEDNAAGMFIRIQEAYQVLSDANARTRYEAGLRLEASLGTPSPDALNHIPIHNYCPPLRCGYVQAECHDVVGRYVVDKILAWEDIVKNGKTLVVSWPAGANRWEEQWV